MFNIQDFAVYFFISFLFKFLYYLLDKNVMPDIKISYAILVKKYIRTMIKIAFRIKNV